MRAVDPIKVVNLRLKCDANGCEYEEPIEAVTTVIIDKLCPRCGASLLSREDYSAALFSLAIVSGMNAWVGPVNESVAGGPPAFSINPRKGSDYIGELFSKLSANSRDSGASE